MVALQDMTRAHICGGSLIASKESVNPHKRFPRKKSVNVFFSFLFGWTFLKYVLTAAHCTRTSKNFLRVDLFFSSLFFLLRVDLIDYMKYLSFHNRLRSSLENTTRIEKMRHSWRLKDSVWRMFLSMKNMSGILKMTR